jgi:hypothetical protein
MLWMLDRGLAGLAKMCRVNPGLSRYPQVSISRASAEAGLLWERDLACLLAKHALQHTAVLANGPSKKGTALATFPAQEVSYLPR